MVLRCLAVDNTSIWRKAKLIFFHVPDLFFVCLYARLESGLNVDLLSTVKSLEMRVNPKKMNLILFVIHFGLTLSQLAPFCLRSQPVSTSEFCVYFEHAATGRKVKTFGIFNCKLKSVNIFDIRNQKWNINFWSYLRQHCLAISPKKRWIYRRFDNLTNNPEQWILWWTELSTNTKMRR